MAVTLTNAFSINMLNGNGTVSFEKIPVEEVKSLLAEGFVSAIGHAETAKILEGMLGVSVPVNRASVKLNGPMVVAQYMGPRLPEGATTLPEGAKIEFWKVELV